MKAIIQPDIFDPSRLSIFSADSGDILGYLHGTKAVPIDGSTAAEFNSREAAIKYLLATEKPKEVKEKVQTNQINLF